MEVAMTHIAIRHSLLTALAFVSAFAGSPAPAQAEIQHSLSAFQNAETSRTQASKTPKRLSTKKGSQQTGGVQQLGIVEASMNRSE
jgi:hypothetical protein